jgi:phenylacetate-coenzyme A ligase PaaK-like adenylate-forming protein
MHLNEDLCIFEPVDSAGAPVDAGERANKVYITPLFNQAQPLIRYELSDELTLLEGPCPCGSQMRRIDDIQGRADDVFSYHGGITVHPLTFRSQLGRHPHIIEYQVQQTERGAAITIRSDKPIDTALVSSALEHELARLGLEQPKVETKVVAALDRQQTGKVKRFIPGRPLQREDTGSST